MNDGKKVVFSRTLHTSPWANTRILNGDIASEVRKLKSEKGEGIAILGSGSITTQLTKEGLIDEYQFVVYPVMLGKGRQLFAGLDKQLELEQTGSRSFANGNVVLTYERTK
jgi:dihydrofolate reductase